MSRKSGNRFSDKDMRKTKESRARPDSIESGCALVGVAGTHSPLAQHQLITSTPAPPGVCKIVLCAVCGGPAARPPFARARRAIAECAGLGPSDVRKDGVALPS